MKAEHFVISFASGLIIISERLYPGLEIGADLPSKNRVLFFTTLFHP